MLMCLMLQAKHHQKRPTPLPRGLLEALPSMFAGTANLLTACLATGPLHRSRPYVYRIKPGLSLIRHAGIVMHAAGSPTGSSAQPSAQSESRPPVLPHGSAHGFHNITTSTKPAFITATPLL